MGDDNNDDNDEHAARAPAKASQERSIERDRAVEQLRAVGMRAFARDWAMGETVAVGISPIKEWPGLCRAGLYLAPARGSGGWLLHDPCSGESISFASVDAAIAATIVQVRRVEERLATTEQEESGFQSVFVENMANFDIGTH